MGIMRGYLLAPSRALHFLLILLGMFVAQGASNAVLVRNQANYLYPANGDSIGYLLGSLLSLGYLVQLRDWGDANHYLIGIAQASIGIMLLAYLYLEYRRANGPSAHRSGPSA